MRVALFSNTADPHDGYGNITVELSRALHAAGVDITLFLPPPRSARGDTVVVSPSSLRINSANQQFPFLVSYTLPKYVYRIWERSGPGYFFPPKLTGFDLVHDLFAFPYCI